MSGMMPESLARTIASVHGERGREWLAAFDDLIAYCERTYRPRISYPYDLSFNYVAAAMLEDGTDAALKLCVPNEESRSEEQALRRFAGEGPSVPGRGRADARIGAASPLVRWRNGTIVRADNRKRMLQWAMSFGVLSAWWCVEDGVGDPMASIARAELFELLLDGA